MPGRRAPFLPEKQATTPTAVKQWRNLTRMHADGGVVSHATSPARMSAIVSSGHVLPSTAPGRAQHGIGAYFLNSPEPAWSHGRTALAVSGNDGTRRGLEAAGSANRAGVLRTAGTSFPLARGDTFIAGSSNPVIDLARSAAQRAGMRVVAPEVARAFAERAPNGASLALDSTAKRGLIRALRGKEAGAPVGMSKEKHRALSRADAHFTAQNPNWDEFVQHAKRKSFVKAVGADPRADATLRRHVEQMHQLHAGKRIKTVTGDTGKYQVVKKPQGGLACTCPDWRYRRSVSFGEDQKCKHIRAHEAAQEKTGSVLLRQTPWSQRPQLLADTLKRNLHLPDGYQLQEAKGARFLGIGAPTAKLKITDSAGNSIHDRSIFGENPAKVQLERSGLFRPTWDTYANSLFLKPEHHGHGVGSALVRAIQHSAHDLQTTGVNTIAMDKGRYAWTRVPGATFADDETKKYMHETHQNWRARAGNEHRPVLSSAAAPHEYPKEFLLQDDLFEDHVPFSVPLRFPTLPSPGTPMQHTPSVKAAASPVLIGAALGGVAGAAREHIKQRPERDAYRMHGDLGNISPDVAKDRAKGRLRRVMGAGAGGAILGGLAGKMVQKAVPAARSAVQTVSHDAGHHFGRGAVEGARANIGDSPPKGRLWRMMLGGLAAEKSAGLSDNIASARAHATMAIAGRTDPVAAGVAGVGGALEGFGKNMLRTATKGSVPTKNPIAQAAGTVARKAGGTMGRLGSLMQRLAPVAAMAVT